MFKVFESNVKVTNLKVVSEKMTVGTAYSTHKDGNNFVKTFVECKIVGNALKKLNELGLKNKDKITVLEGVIRNEPFTNKMGEVRSKLVLTIFELKEYEKPQENN